MNVIIEEEVLVPDVPIIEEQVLYPSNPISVEEEVLVPAIVQKPNEVEEVIDPAWREYVYNVEDKFVNKDFTNGVIVARELFIPDDYNLDLYMELPEQEALELQEKYNNNGGDRNIN